MIKKILSVILFLFWSLWFAVELLVWNVDIRYRLLGDHAVVETIASLVNDLVWIPLALVLPFYLLLLTTKSTDRRSIKILISIVCVGLFAVGLSDLAGYFRFLLILILPIFALFIKLLVTQRYFRLHVFVYILVILAFIFHYHRQLMPNRVRSADGAKSQITLMSYNILSHQSNERRQLAIDLIAEEKPDIVFIQEMSRSTRRALQNNLDELYPYQIWSDRMTGYMGGVILSRVPFVTAENIRITTNFMRGHTNLNHAVIEVEGQPVHLYNCHLYHGSYSFIQLVFGYIDRQQFWKSVNRAYLRHRGEASQIASHVLAQKDPVIFAGDLNDTPNSIVYSHFDGKLVNAFHVAGWGLGTTYGYDRLLNNIPRPLRFLLFDFLRIDHIFCSTFFEIRSARVLPVAGSDHRPQLVTVRFSNSKNL